MSETYYDRLTGRPGAPSDLLPGRWNVPAGVALRMNGAACRGGDRLTPARSNRSWRLGTDAGPIDPALVPDDDVARAVLDVTHPWVRRADWDALATASPLDPALSADAGLSDFEQRAIEKVVHLQQVCWDPRDQLKTVTELLPSHRVRRAAPDAERHLAAHSEDWANRSPVRIRPRRLRALVPQEDLDLYENRVAARLRDRLDDLCTSRIRTLSRRLQEIQALEDYTSDVRGHHRLRNRVATLWAEATDGDDPQARVSALEATVAELQRLRRKLSHLRDSPLYRGVPSTARTSGFLEATNLFTEHEHYREVGALWRELDTLQQQDTLDPQRHHDRWQELCLAFDVFVRLLLVRTLHESGYTPASPSSTFSPGSGPLTLRGPRGTLTAQCGADGILTLTSPRSHTLRVTPLPAALDHVGAPPRAFPDFLVPREHPSTAHAVVYLSNGRGDASDRRHLPEGHVPVGVSPSLLLSSERLAHVVGAWIAGATFTVYPPAVDVPAALAEEIGAGPEGWAPDGPRSAKLLRLPAPGAIDALTDHLRQFARRATNRGDRNDRDAAIERLVDEVDAARATLDALHACPVCRQMAPPSNFTPREAGCFECRCPSCGATWGLNATSDGRPPYPFLDTTAVRALADAPEVDVAREVGRDVLTVPVRRGGEVEWSHPWPE